MATDEDKPLFPTSIYAITKRDHEEMFLSTGRAYDIPAVALRFFNTYGPRQALSNPYTGVMAIFSGRLLNICVWEANILPFSPSMEKLIMVIATERQNTAAMTKIVLLLAIYKN